MPSLFTHEMLPSSSEEAIRRFNEKYLALLSTELPSDWYSRFVTPVDSPRSTFPMSIITAKFRETREESGRFHGLDDKTFDVTVKEFDEGFEAKLFEILTGVFAYKRWMTVANELVVAEAQHHAQQLATLLEAGTSTACAYDNVNFFSASHLANPVDASKGTWSNYQSVAADPTDLSKIQTEMTNMRLVKDLNGNKLGVEPDEIWLPTQKFQAVSDKLNQAFLSGGESNYMAGKLKPIHVKELNDTNDWYLVDSRMISRGFDPMIAAKYTALDGSLGLRYLDESSDHFKTTGKIAVSKHIWCGYSLLFPHAIRRIVGA